MSPPALLAYLCPASSLLKSVDRAGSPGLSVFLESRKADPFRPGTDLAEHVGHAGSARNRLHCVTGATLCAAALQRLISARSGFP